MSQITDVGVAFKFQGADDFESRLRNLETQWKSFSSSLDKAPQVNGHFEKMAKSAEQAQHRITSAMNATKAVVMGILTAKAGVGLFDWAVGNKDVAKAKAFATQFIPKNEAPEYEAAMSRIRNEHEANKADLWWGAYQIDSAMAGKPIEDKLKVFEQIIYYAKLTGKSFEDASKLYKQFLSSFGNALPADKQKTFAEDTLGMLYKIGQISSSDPQQVADAVGRLGQSRMNKGLSQAHMFAEIAALTPALGGKAEMASTALGAIYPRVGTAAEKLVEAFYEQQFATGQTIDRLGKHSRNYGSLNRLKSLAEEGDKQAKEDLANMERWKKEPGRIAAEQAERFIKNKDPYGLWQYLGGLIEQNKANPQAMKIMADAFGLEHSNAVETLIGQYQRGEIKRLETEFENAKGSDAIAARHEADANNLPHKMDLVTQKAQDLSVSIREIFYEPMKLLLEEWKGVFERLEKDLAGPSGLKRIQELGTAATQGFRDVWNKNQTPADDNRSVSKIFQDFVENLKPEEVRAAFQKIATAAQTFLETAGQLKAVIGGLYKAMSWLGLAPAVAKAGAVGAITPGPLPAKAAATGATLAYGGVQEYIKQHTGKPGELDERGMVYISPGAPTQRLQALPQVMSSREAGMMARPSDNLQSAHAGRQPLTIIQQHENVVNLDGKEIARQVAPEVKEMIEGEMQSQNDRNRGNASDMGLF